MYIPHSLLDVDLVREQLAFNQYFKPRFDMRVQDIRDMHIWDIRDMRIQDTHGMRI